MKQISEKYLNLTVLKTLSDGELKIRDSKDNIQNGTVFYTPFGIVIGGLYKEEKCENISKLFLEQKMIGLKSLGENLNCNGEIICVKNASILQNNGHVIYNDCLFIHVDSILGFTLCNLEEAKAELLNID